ncbi:MAG TPA: response regulator transcription factor [Chitinophagaceae bacterium]|nr:response regulator transcription factor [Chitinophagaceae bacterium]
MNPTDFIVFSSFYKMKPGKITLALVDDHQIVIDGLMSLLKGHNKFRFAFATTDPAEVIPKLEQHLVNILLTDVMMPEISGNMLAKKIKEKFPSVKILALSMSGQGELVNEMINEADISGYILKNTGKQDLVEALEKIAAGSIYFSAEVIEELQRVSRRKKEKDEAHLTAREIEIIRLIEKEYNNKQIAEALFISERTVETHRKNIFRKTNTNSVIGLVKYAYEHKLA